MKYKRSLLVLFAILSIFTLCSTVSQAKDSVEWFEEDDEKTIRTISIQLIKEMPTDKLIDSFDVRSDGVIAIAFSDWEHIAVIDSSGDFLYGFKLDLAVNGGIFVLWENDILNILTNRGDNIFSVNENGDILKSGKLTSSSWRSKAELRKKEINGVTYTIRSSPAYIFSTGYSQLTKIAGDGEVTDLYRISNTYTIKMAIIFSIFFLIIISLVAYVSLKPILKPLSGRRIK
jgi:hypothetical protein